MAVEKQIISGGLNAVDTLTSTENIALASMVIFCTVFLVMVVILWKYTQKINDRLYDMQIKTLETLSGVKTTVSAVLAAIGSKD